MGLSLDLGVVFLPKTMSELFSEVSETSDLSLRLSKIDGYVERLEEERKKIDAFKRELPLCLLLLNDVIGRLKEEAKVCRKSVPSKRKFEDERGAKMENDKKSWMSTARLWTSNTQLHMANEEDDESVIENPIKGSNFLTNGGAFRPFGIQSDQNLHKSKTLVNSDVSSQSQLKFQSNPWSRQERKERRRWSPELHRKFVGALEKLGGSQVATPKQIREMMEVEGLTNDEVKSHLQKYRIHVRKTPDSSSTDQNPQSLMLGSRGCSSNEGNSSEEDERSDGKSWKSAFQRQEEIHSCVA